MIQTFAVVLIVGAAFLAVTWKVFNAWVRTPLANYFLSKGKVQWAMRLRHPKKEDSTCCSP